MTILMTIMFSAVLYSACTDDDNDVWIWRHLRKSYRMEHFAS